MGDHILNSEDAVYAPRPTEIPEYAADTSVSCKTGQIVPWTGVWVPADGMGKAALVFARQGLQIMQPAYHFIRKDEDTGDEEYDLVEATFHPVRPTGRMVPLPAADTEDATPAQGNVPAGPSLPQSRLLVHPSANGFSSLLQGRRNNVGSEKRLGRSALAVG